MTSHRIRTRTTALLSTMMLAVALSRPVMAHCDSMDGPVVRDAQRALAGKKVDPVLKWVRAEDEEVIRKTFEMTLAVRSESEVAKNVADRYFIVPARARASRG